MFHKEFHKEKTTHNKITDDFLSKLSDKFKELDERVAAIPCLFSYGGAPELDPSADFIALRTTLYDDIANHLDNDPKYIPAINFLDALLKWIKYPKPGTTTITVGKDLKACRLVYAIAKLNAEIAMLENIATPPQNIHRGNFIAALRSLHDELKTDINAHVNGAAELNVTSTNRAYQVTENATAMLLSMRAAGATKEDKLLAVKIFEENCEPPLGIKTFLKAVATVVITGVGFILGALIGAGIGFACGVGSIFTTAVAATEGAMLGVAAAGIVTGLAFGMTAGFLLFKPAPLTKKARNVTNEARIFIDTAVNTATKPK